MTRHNSYTLLLRIYLIFLFLGILRVTNISACNVTSPPVIWGKESYPNPQEDVNECGRNCTKSWVCDPSEILSSVQADDLDNTIWETSKSGNCTCPECNNEAGHFIYVALMTRMVVPSGTSKGMAAFYFAEHLRKKWMNGTCGNIVVIVISTEDRQVQTNAGPEAFKTLTLDCIRLIYNEVRSRLTDGEFYSAVKAMIHRYKETFYLGRCPLKEKSTSYTSSTNLSAFIPWIVLVGVFVVAACIGVCCVFGGKMCDDCEFCEIICKCLTCTCCEEKKANRYSTATSNTRPIHFSLSSSSAKPYRGSNTSTSNNVTSHKSSSSSGYHHSNNDWHHSTSFTHNTSSYSGGGGCDSGFSGGGSSDGGGGGGGDF